MPAQDLISFPGILGALCCARHRALLGGDADADYLTTLPCRSWSTGISRRSRPFQSDSSGETYVSGAGWGGDSRRRDPQCSARTAIANWGYSDRVGGWQFSARYVAGLSVRV